MRKRRQASRKGSRTIYGRFVLGPPEGRPIEPGDLRRDQKVDLLQVQALSRQPAAITFEGTTPGIKPNGPSEPPVAIRLLLAAKVGNISAIRATGLVALASPFRVFTPSELGASAKVPVL
jgi:hypothetical protein